MKCPVVTDAAPIVGTAERTSESTLMTMPDSVTLQTRFVVTKYGSTNYTTKHDNEMKHGIKAHFHAA